MPGTAPGHVRDMYAARILIAQREYARRAFAVGPSPAHPDIAAAVAARMNRQAVFTLPNVTAGIIPPGAEAGQWHDHGSRAHDLVIGFADQLPRANAADLLASAMRPGLSWPAGT